MNIEEIIDTLVANVGRHVVRLIPTPCGFIEPGMVVVDRMTATAAHARAMSRKRPRHEPIGAYRLVQWDHSRNSYGEDVWTYLAEPIGGGLPISGFASGLPCNAFGALVLR